MSEETPKPTPEENPPPEQRTDESAAAAKEAAKEFADNAGKMFKGLDQKLQIYVTALGITLLCSLFFAAFVVKPPKEAKEAMEAISSMTGADIRPKKVKSTSLVGLHSYGGAFWGKLATLAAGAGIGILLWSKIANRKDTWIPLGLAGAAGICALSILLTRSGTGGYYANIDGTLLGWWLPLACAVAATVVSVQRILKA